MEPGGLHAQCHRNRSSGGRMKSTNLAILVLAGLGSIAAASDAWKLPPETAQYKDGPGKELAVTSCSLCHSADYLSTQPPLSSAAWKATVEKMRSRYGAPIDTNNVDAVVKYLSSAYGQNR